MAPKRFGRTVGGTSLFLPVEKLNLRKWWVK